MIRVCFNNKNSEEIGPIINFFHKLGIKVSLNLTHVSCCTVEQCLEMANVAEKNGADFFYIADSNGNLLPEDVEKYVDVLISGLGGKIKIGFHAHDNLGLAQINAIKALEKGAEMIDSSIMGFGKGAGNLKTELFPILLSRKKVADKKYDFKMFFDVANYFNQSVTKINNFEEQYKYSLYGLSNVGLKDDKEIKKLSLINGMKDYELAFKYIDEFGCDLEKLKEFIISK